MLFIFTGDGKGKTSAAIGTLIRATGAGMSCAIVFFDKNPDYCNELESLKKLGIEAHVFGQNRVHENSFRLTNDRKDIDEAKNALKRACGFIGHTDVLVLDEILNSIRTNQLSLEEALKFIYNFPKEKFLILTGRGLPEEIKTQADLISEIKDIKHPIKNGVDPIKGIDF